MSVLVIAEHDNATIKKATLSTVTAAGQMGGDIHVLVAGQDCQAAADAAAKIAGVSKVLIADAPHYNHELAENISPLVAKLAADYSHIITPATTMGKNFMPRVAALLDVAQISEIIAVESADTFVRPIYAGNVFVNVQSKDAIKVITVRATSFDAAAAEGGSAAVEAVETTPAAGMSEYVSQEVTESDRPEMTSARVVVAGGRALGSSENFKLLDDLADKLGAAVGATRAAVDAGYVPNDYQIGQTGKVIAPELYIGIGLSGAIQHLAGMKDSKVIVCINKDEEAPIFQVSDYGLVGDLFTVVPELTKAL
ncbi:MAG: electron transfer flavoprotein subunit alpha/FixB family protein [Candidatus Competibacteraceae bacterium]|nr:electron transfer flavoprotein subunit alpha/FixB family protein [Candidatus Competibacteraceae bacterium]